MKRTNLIHKYTVLIISLSLFVFITGCHKDYIYINNEFGRINAYNNSKTEVAFYKFIHIAKPPKNFGTQKTIFKKVALYTFNINTKELKEVFSFEDLPYGRDGVKQGISYRNNILAFSLKPISGWKYHTEFGERFSGIHLFFKDQGKIIRLNPEGFYPELSPDESKLLYFTKDSIRTVLWLSSINNEQKTNNIISDTLSQYTKFIWKSDNEIIFGNEKNQKIIEISSLEITDVDTFDLMYKEKIDNKQLAKLTKDITYKEWGIDLNKSVPKSKKERINDIITEYGGPSYRMAVFQAIKEELTIKEIEIMLDELGMLRENLSSNDKQNPDQLLNILISQLKVLLESKR